MNLSGIEGIASVAAALIWLVALEHFFFFWLEAVAWTRPLGLKVFRQTRAQAQASARLAANQGLYNGFLAAGLLWGLFHADLSVGRQICSFFLICVGVAGAFGALTVNRRIFVVQSVPALVAFVLLRMTV